MESGVVESKERRFGRRVKQLRQSIGLTQEELARRMTAAGQPLHPTMVTKLEGGNRPTSIGELVSLANILRVPVGALFEEAVEDSLREDLAILTSTLDANTTEQEKIGGRMMTLRAEEKEVRAQIRAAESRLARQRLESALEQREMARDFFPADTEKEN